MPARAAQAVPAVNGLGFSSFLNLPTTTNARPHRQNALLQLQRQHGNAQVQQFLHQARPTIQRETASDGSEVKDTPQDAAATAANAGEQTEWNALVEAKLEQFLHKFANIPVQVSWEVDGQPQTATETVHTPYFINSTATSASKARFDAAAANRKAATKDEGKAPVDASWNALHGKSTPEEIQTILQTAVNEGKVPTPAGKPHPDGTDLRAWLVKYGLGVDCSGFVTQALNEVMAELQSVTGVSAGVPELKMGERSSGLLTGDAKGFRKLTRPGDFRPGDTMGITGHIRIIMGVTEKENGIEFVTAESRAGSKDGVADIGIDRNVWRYDNPDALKGLKKPDGTTWKASSETPTYGRYEALAQFQAENVPPTPEIAAPNPETDAPAEGETIDDAETWLATILAEGADALAGIMALITTVPATLGDMVTEFGTLVTGFFTAETTSTEPPTPEETVEPGAAALAAALAQGERDANVLSNVVFYARHSDRQNRPIDPTAEPDAVKEWKAIRDNEVKPALAAPPPVPTPIEPTEPIPDAAAPGSEPPQAVTPEGKETGSLFGLLPDLQQIGGFLREHILFPILGETPAEPEAPTTTPGETPAAETPAAAPEQPANDIPVIPPAPANTKYKITYNPPTEKSEGFQLILDGKKLQQSLLDKVSNMANFALENDLVTGNITFTSGVRSPKVAHRWSTAWSITQGKIGLNKLQELENSQGEKGKDEDGNTWYQEGWTMSQAKANANNMGPKKPPPIAAEGYDDEHAQEKKPNNYSGVTRHATGLAIDAVFPWKASGEVKNPQALAALKESINKKYAKDPEKLEAALAEVDRFVARGSYSELAEKTVDQFGLQRPMLHSSSTEDWHYEEK